MSDDDPDDVIRLFREEAVRHRYKTRWAEVSRRTGPNAAIAFVVAVATLLASYLLLVGLLG